MNRSARFDAAAWHAPIFITPTKTIYVLDDGHRPAIAALAQELGVQYLSRPDNLHRKAGNLNHALAHTHGDLIAILDCDFIPFSRFLDRTVGIFKDPKVALVKTAQHCFNSDFHNRNLGLDVLVPDDMDYFFRYVQVIRDPFTAVVCCGTSYLARRSVLESTGGYVTHCIVEDNQTGTRLLTRDWRMVCLDEVLSLGRCPEPSVMTWSNGCAGCRQHAGVHIPQRGSDLEDLEFLAEGLLPESFFSLLTPIFRAIYIIFPLMSMLVGFTLIAAPPVEYMTYGLPFVIMLYFLPSWQTNGHYFHFWTEVYESLFCFPALKRMSQILFRPFRSVGSLVTNKEVNSPKQTHDLRFALPVLTYLFIFVGVLVLNHGLPRSGGHGVLGHHQRCLRAGASLLLNDPGPGKGEIHGRLWVPQYHLELPVQLMRTSRLRRQHLLGLTFEMPASETEAALIQLIYCEKCLVPEGEAGGQHQGPLPDDGQLGARRTDPAPLLSQMIGPSGSTKT